MARELISKDVAEMLKKGELRPGDSIQVDPNQITFVDVPEYYGQSIALHVESNSFSVVFNRKVPVMFGAAQGSAPKASVVIHMSPQTAKDLAVLLTENVQKFENEWGRIETAYTKRRSEQAKKAKPQKAKPA